MKLKRCPFCPDKTPLSVETIPVKLVSPDGSWRYVNDYAVTCDNCDTIGPPASNGKEAAWLWNQRPSTAK